MTELFLSLLEQFKCNLQRGSLCGGLIKGTWWVSLPICPWWYRRRGTGGGLELQQWGAAALSFQMFTHHSLQASVLMMARVTFRGGWRGRYPAGNADRDLREDPQAGAEDQWRPRVPGSEGREADCGQKTCKCNLCMTGDQYWHAVDPQTQSVMQLIMCQPPFPSEHCLIGPKMCTFWKEYN